MEGAPKRVRHEVATCLANELRYGAIPCNSLPLFTLPSFHILLPPIGVRRTHACAYPQINARCRHAPCHQPEHAPPLPSTGTRTQPAYIL